MGLCQGQRRQQLERNGKLEKRLLPFFVKLGATPASRKTCQNPSDQTIGDEKNRKKERAKRDLIYKPEFVETYLIKCSSQY